MAISLSLQVGLKEWDSVCRALEQGRQILLLRKGGIHESAGEFELEHAQFLLFPTVLHQKREMLKDSEHNGFVSASAEPAQVQIRSLAAVTDILQLRNRAQMDALNSFHIWTPPLIDMRFNYRPQNPLYLVLVRAYWLRSSISLQNTPAYAGCKSWVPLDQPITTDTIEPSLPDAQFESVREQILDIVRSI